MTVSTVTQQLENDINDSISITAISRSTMIGSYNTYNIADQVSIASVALVFAGLVGWADINQSVPNIRGTTSVVTSGNNNLVTYTPQFPVSALNYSNLNRPGFTNLVRLVAVNDYQSNSLDTAITPQSVVIPATIPDGATSVSAAAVTFTITDADDFNDTVKLQVASSFAVGGVTVTTKWMDATAVPSFGLWTVPDAPVIGSVLDSEQNGLSAFEISIALPNQRQLRGLLWRDLIISTRLNGTTAWLSYAAEPNTFSGTAYKGTLPDGSSFVQGGQYDFRAQLRGSVSVSSAIIAGLQSSVTSAYISPNAFKNVEIALLNEAGQSTFTAPTVAWVPGVGGAAGYSDLINFVPDEASPYYIDPLDREQISVMWRYSISNGAFEDVASGQKLYQNLINGREYPVKLQGRFSYEVGGRTHTEYSKIISLIANPRGSPSITNASVSYTYNTLISGVSGTGSASTYALASAAPGVVVSSIQSVFSATLDARGSTLSTYTVVYVPQEYSSAISQSDIVKSNVDLAPAPDNFVNGVLTLRPVFVAKACILYVTNGVGSAVQIIPVGGLNSV
jgi:hypothetical protein